MRSNTPKHIKNTSITLPGKMSFKIITYGLFFVFCQLIFMLLRLNILLLEHEPSHLYNIILPEFEYPLINIVLIIGGAYFIDMLFLRS